jgi:glycosyltransferase involved in cell wall biosynthesis
MAQVEAQGWGLPVIASRFCGSVVRDGVNGIVLAEVTSESVAEALKTVAARPSLLEEFARRANVGPESSLDRLAENLQQLVA